MNEYAFDSGPKIANNTLIKNSCKIKLFTCQADIKDSIPNEMKVANSDESERIC